MRAEKLSGHPQERPRARGRLGRRIMLWLLLLSLVPLLASATAGYMVSRRIIMGQTRQYLTALTEMSADHVAGELERHQLALQAFAVSTEIGRLATTAVEDTRPAIRASAAGQLSALLRSRQLELQPFSDVFVVNPAGEVIAATSDTRLSGGWRPLPQNDSLGTFPALFAEPAFPSDSDTGLSPVDDSPSRLDS